MKEPTRKRATKRILVVEDDPETVLLLWQFLTDKGYRVLRAENGLEGISKARRHRPHLIILDLLMPGMHGFEICRTLRADDKLKDVRIIVASGKRYQVDFRAVNRLGANMFVPKPYDGPKILEAVVAMIGHPSDPLPLTHSTLGPG